MIYRLLMFLFSLVPAIVHFFFVGPILWRHQSSAAFDAWIFFTIVSIVFPIMIFNWNRTTAFREKRDRLRRLEE